MVDVFILVCYIMLINHKNTYNYLLYFKRCLLMIRKLNCGINASGFDLKIFRRDMSVFSEINRINIVFEPL